MANDKELRKCLKATHHLAWMVNMWAQNVKTLLETKAAIEKDPDNKRLRKALRHNLRNERTVAKDLSRANQESFEYCRRI